MPGQCPKTHIPSLPRVDGGGFMHTNLIHSLCSRHISCLVSFWGVGWALDHTLWFSGTIVLRRPSLVLGSKLRLATYKANTLFYASSLALWFAFLFVVFGPHPATLWGYSWLCSQESFLVVLREPHGDARLVGVQGKDLILCTISCSVIFVI